MLNSAPPAAGTAPCTSWGVENSWKNSSVEKDLGALGGNKLDMRQQCVCRIQKAVVSWAALRALPAGQGAMILLCSALPRPHLGCWVQHLAPLSKKVMEALE